MNYVVRILVQKSRSQLLRVISSLERDTSLLSPTILGLSSIIRGHAVSVTHKYILLLTLLRKSLLHLIAIVATRFYELTCNNGSISKTRALFFAQSSFFSAYI